MEPVEVNTGEEIEPEIKKEEPVGKKPIEKKEPVYEVVEPEIIPEVKQPIREHIENKKNEPKVEIIAPVVKKKKKFSFKNFFTSEKKIKKANIIEDIKTTEKNLENIQNEKRLIRNELREESKNERSRMLSRAAEEILKSGVDTGTIESTEIDKIDKDEVDRFLDLAKKIGIKINT
jgi:hypothetical protein